ncbi:hypothetical protein, partial [Salinimicrobium soli]|uniref:hypothetical protein n=1 Tax=Salinimicrobium soli TaxID=1254399 RepID=UPI003AADCBAC
MKEFTLGSFPLQDGDLEKTVKECTNYFKSFLHILFLVLFFSFSTGIQAQKVEKLEQGQNGTAGIVEDPVIWVTGALDKQHNHLTEGMPVPYHIELINLKVGDTYNITLGFDTKKGGKHAQDYLTTYDYPGKHNAFGHAPEAINPLTNTGLAGSGMSPLYVAIPLPINNYMTSVSTGGSGKMEPITTFTALNANDRRFAFWNVASTAPDIPVLKWVDPSQNFETDAVAESHLKITFKATAATVVIAWAGNIAEEATWGEGMSARSIPGSSFHMFAAECGNLTGCGGKDVAIKSDAVTPPPDCTINGDTTTCEDPSTNLTFSTDEAGTSYKWEIINSTNVTGAAIVGSDAGASVTVDPGSVDSGFSSGTFDIKLTVTLAVTGGELSTPCQKTVTVYDNPDFDVKNLEACEDGTKGYAVFNLNSAISNKDGTPTFYDVDPTTLPAPTAISTPGTYQVNFGSSASKEVTIYAVLENSSDGTLDCTTTKTFKVTAYDNP